MAVVNRGINGAEKVRGINWWLNEWMNEWNKGDHIWTEDNKIPWPKDYDQSNYASSLQWLELLLKYLLKFVVQAFPVD